MNAVDFQLECFWRFTLSTKESFLFTHKVSAQVRGNIFVLHLPLICDDSHIGYYKAFSPSAGPNFKLSEVVLLTQLVVGEMLGTC